MKTLAMITARGGSKRIPRKNIKDFNGKPIMAYSIEAALNSGVYDEVMVSTGINVPPCGWYYNELKHFAGCIRENKPSPYVTREQLLTVMEILEEISAKWRM